MSRNIQIDRNFYEWLSELASGRYSGFTMFVLGMLLSRSSPADRVTRGILFCLQLLSIEIFGVVQLDFDCSTSAAYGRYVRQQMFWSYQMYRNFDDWFSAPMTNKRQSGLTMYVVGMLMSRMLTIWRQSGTSTSGRRCWRVIDNQGNNAGGWNVDVQVFSHTWGTHGILFRILRFTVEIFGDDQVVFDCSYSATRCECVKEQVPL